MNNGVFPISRMTREIIGDRSYKPGENITIRWGRYSWAIEPHINQKVVIYFRGKVQAGIVTQFNRNLNLYSVEVTSFPEPIQEKELP